MTDDSEHRNRAIQQSTILQSTTHNALHYTQPPHPLPHLPLQSQLLQAHRPPGLLVRLS